MNFAQAVITKRTQLPTGDGTEFELLNPVLTNAVKITINPTISTIDVLEIIPHVCREGT